MKLLIRLVLIVVLFTIIVGVRSCSSQQASAIALDQAMAMVQALPYYREHQVFYDEALESYHDIAFSLNYRQRRFSSSFDELGYKQFLFGEIMKRAKDAKNTQVVETMRQELLNLKP